MRARQQDRRGDDDRSYHDGRVGDVEDRPNAKIEKIGDRSEDRAVDEVADDAAAGDGDGCEKHSGMWRSHEQEVGERHYRGQTEQYHHQAHSGQKSKGDARVMRKSKAKHAVY